MSVGAVALGALAWLVIPTGWYCIAAYKMKGNHK
jgi:hypothetical protein